MEETHKIDNLVNTENSVQKENASNDGMSKNKPFKKKKFNGHLRTNNKKEKFVRPQDNEYEEEIIASAPKPIFNELFYFLRQKFFYNKVPFFELLDNVLKTMEFKDIKEGNMTLFSYSAMYEKNEIFLELAQKYPKDLNKQDFENYIIPVCLNKNEETLAVAIQVFNNNISLDDNFIKEVITKMAKISYRDNNNNLILNWLSPRFTPELIHSFWFSTFTDKNISLANVALKNSVLKTYLKENFEQFVEILNKIGKKIEITRQLNLVEQVHKVTEPTNKPIKLQEEPKIYLGNKEEQIKNLTKEDITTKITIKRRKVVA